MLGADSFSENKLFTFIPTLNLSANKTLYIYGDNYYNYLINYFLSKIIFGEKDNIIKIYSNKASLSVNEEIKVYLDASALNIKDTDFSLMLYNNNNEIISKINNFDILDDNLLLFKFKVDIPDIYKIQSEIKINNKLDLKSNLLNIQVNDLDLEVNNVYLNKKNLQAISNKSGGTFYYFNELNNYINIIKPNTSFRMQINRIKIFNFQLVWLVIIFLFIIEWIIRKNKGLL